MENKLKIVKEILKKYDQLHLLQFYSELTEEQKSNLLNQILKINFEEILICLRNIINIIVIETV